MNGEARNVSTVLALAGALPFWLLMVAPETVAGMNTATMFVSYGAIIGAFMAGTLWGRAQNGVANVSLIVASNVIALIFFATAIVTILPIALLLQLVLFGLLIVADYRIYAGDAERRWYWKLRWRVTALVSLSYDVMLLDYILNICDGRHTDVMAFSLTPVTL